MATTTNFGWETPDDTDLVKDGAAAMRTLGNAIDTSFVDLKGGTTGQVLAKASNTDLDFTWATDATGIPATIFDAKGDLIAATAADTASRLAVGTNGQVLTADSTASTGMKWASPTSNATSYSLLGTGTLTGAATITVSGISGMNKLWIVLDVAGSSASASSRFTVRLNSDSGTNYLYTGFALTMGTTFNVAGFTRQTSTDSQYEVCTLSTNAGSAASGGIFIDGCNSSGVKMIHSAFGVTAAGGDSQVPNIIHGYWNNSATVTSFSLISTIGNFDAGTYRVYGSAN